MKGHFVQSNKKPLNFRCSLAATIGGRANEVVAAWVHRNRNWITFHLFKHISGLKQSTQIKKKKVKTRPRKSQPFPNSKCENQTRGVEEREVVLGSKEKIVRTEEEEEEEVESLRLDLPNTTQLTFSGRRIHDPHVTVPCCCSDPPPSIRISPRELKFKRGREDGDRKFVQSLLSSGRSIYACIRREEERTAKCLLLVWVPHDGVVYDTTS